MRNDYYNLGGAFRHKSTRIALNSRQTKEVVWFVLEVFADLFQKVLEFPCH